MYLNKQYNNITKEQYNEMIRIAIEQDLNDISDVLEYLEVA